MVRSTLLLFAGVLLAGAVAQADATPPETGASSHTAPPGLAARIWELTDTVLDEHINPPTRPQMVLEGLNRFYKVAGVAVPAGLARRVSAITCAEQLVPILDEAWSLATPLPLEKGRGDIGPEEILIDALLRSVPGGARLLSAAELRVDEQFAGNRYVGLHIALGFKQDAKRPVIMQVLEGGPAARAGVKEGDLLEEIDGAGTEGLAVKNAVERLRGPEGTPVTIRVRQPKSAESRVYTITRGVLPRLTVKGIRNRADGSLDVLINGPGAIGYLKLEEILGSTPHELRVLAATARRGGGEGLCARPPAGDPGTPPPDCPGGRLPARSRNDRAGAEGSERRDIPGRARCALPGLAAGRAREHRHRRDRPLAGRRAPGQPQGVCRRQGDRAYGKRGSKAPKSAQAHGRCLCADGRARRRRNGVDRDDDRPARAAATAARSSTTTTRE